MDKKHKIISFDDKMKSILNFIKKSRIEKIKDGLLDVIKYNEFCPKILGSGSFGSVYIPSDINTINTQIYENLIEIPVVIKKAHDNDNINIKKDGLTIKDNILFIKTLDGNLFTELLILLKIREIYNKTIHLPLIVGYGTCNNSNNVDKIITMRYGLKKPIKIDLPNKITENNLTTLRELFEYIYYKKNIDGSVKLPNGLICNNISELFDNIVISYLTTHIFLCKNNIYPNDMHYENIFIHWLNENSYYKDKSIKDLKEVIYKINNKYYKIKTFGFLIILGDTGCFSTKLKNNVIIPSCYIYENYYKQIKVFFKNNAIGVFYQFLDFIKYLISYRNFKKTESFKIKSSYEIYDNKVLSFEVYDNLNDNLMPKIEEILELFYEKYGVKNFIQTKNNILIDLDE